MYIDPHNFKGVNDRFGLDVGDQTLRQATRTLQENLRCTDYIARIGGDEFAVVLTETGPEADQLVGGKIRTCLGTAVEKSPWPVTFSIGRVTAQGPARIDPARILRQAK